MSGQRALMTLLMAVGLQLWAASAVAAGGSTSEKKAQAIAQQYIKLGDELFQLESYDEAVQNFLRAETTLAEADMDVPPLLYRSIARCYDQLGQVAAALGYYKKFIAFMGPDTAKMQATLEQARDAEKRLETLLDRTAIEFDVQPDGALVRVDGRAVGRTPLPEPVRVKPGPHQVTLAAEGCQPRALALQLKAGAMDRVVVSLDGCKKETSSSDAPQRADADVERDVVGPAISPGLLAGERRLWAAGGLGALGLGAAIGAVVLVLDAGAEDSLGDKRLSGSFLTRDEAVQARSEAQDHYDTAGVERNVALGLACSAAAALGGAAWLYFMVDEAAAQGQEAAAWLPQLQLGLSPGGASVAASLAF